MEIYRFNSGERIMRGLIAAVVVIAHVTFNNLASATDISSHAYLPAVATATPYNWSGWHIGVNAGYGFGSGDVALSGTDPNVQFGIAHGIVPAHLGVNHLGIAGGGQIGFDQQFGSWVAGLEADIQGGDLRGSTVYVFPGDALIGAPLEVTTYKSKMDVFGTLRARLGYAWDRSLLYVTGGFAYGRLTQSAAVNIPALSTQLATSGTSSAVGYAFGGGVETAIAHNWTFRVEYLRYGLGATTLTLSDPVFVPQGATFRFDNSGHLARVALNRRF